MESFEESENEGKTMDRKSLLSCFRLDKKGRTIKKKIGRSTFLEGYRIGNNKENHLKKDGMNGPGE